MANRVLAQDKAAAALTRLARPLGSKAFAPQTRRMIDPAPVTQGKPAIQMHALGAKAPGAAFAPKVAPNVAPMLMPKTAPKTAPQFAAQLAARVAPKTAPYGQATTLPAHVQHAELKVQRSK
jgi:hypothetical protein